MTEKEARIAFNMIPTVGAVTLDRLLRETHGDVAAAVLPLLSLRVSTPSILAMSSSRT